MSNIQNVVVFIPAYNEELSIGRTIKRVLELYPESLTRSKGYLLKLIVVNDGSTDKTQDIVGQHNVLVKSIPKNKGLGAATRVGMEWALQLDADVVVKLDADFQHDPEDIEKVIIPLLKNEADLCWGSRFKGQINYKMPLIRKIGNKFFTWLMNQLTDFEISDAQTGLMAFNKNYLEVFEIFGNYNPPQQLLLDANLKHMRYVEVPVVFHPRTKGKSFVTLHYPIFVMANIFRILIYGDPIKVFSYIGVIMILFAFIYYFIYLLSIYLNWGTEQYFIEFLSLVFLLVGIQSFFFGILADIILRKRK